MSKHLYFDVAQEIAARNGYRPTGEEAQAAFAAQFPALTLATIDTAFGGWGEANKAHFANGGSFDRIYTAK